MSSYLHNIHIRPQIFEGGGDDGFDIDNRDNSAVGGFPIFLEPSFTGPGVTKMILEGMNQIRHLSIPVGLVYRNPHRKPMIKKHTDDSVINTDDYDKLLLSCCNTKPARVTRKKRSNIKNTKKKTK
jgi:hypothetical protein